MEWSGPEGSWEVRRTAAGIDVFVNDGGRPRRIASLGRGSLWSFDETPYAGTVLFEVDKDDDVPVLIECPEIGAGMLRRWLTEMTAAHRQERSQG